MDKLVEMAIKNINQAIVDHYVERAQHFEHSAVIKEFMTDWIHDFMVETTVEDPTLKNKIADYILEAIYFDDLAAKAYDRLAYGLDEEPITQAELYNRDQANRVGGA